MYQAIQTCEWSCEPLVIPMLRDLHRTEIGASRIWDPCTWVPCQICIVILLNLGILSGRGFQVWYAPWVPWTGLDDQDQTMMDLYSYNKLDKRMSPTRDNQC